MLAILIYVLLGLAYSFVGTIAYNIHLGIRLPKCPGVRAGLPSGDAKDKCGHDHETAATFSGMFWPLAATFLAGDLVSSPFTRRSERTARRREDEIAEAKHRKELARIRAEETRELERALK